MKCIKYIGVAVVVVFASSSVVAKDDEGDDDSKTVGKVTWLKPKKGGVKRSRSADDDGEDLARGSKLFLNDFVRTGRKSRVEITMKDGSVLRIDERSTVRLTEFQIKAGAPTGSGDLLAKVWLNVKKQGEGSGRYKVETPTAVAGVRGTVFRVDIATDKATTVKVYRGQVAVSNDPVAGPPPPPKKAQEKGDDKGEKGDAPPPPPEERREVAGPDEVTKEKWEEIVLGMMQEIRVSADGKIGKARPIDVAAEKDDEWVLWNQKRDKKVQ